MTEASMAPLLAVRSAREVTLLELGLPVDELTLRARFMLLVRGES
jgi:hypothetical protein